MSAGEKKYEVYRAAIASSTLQWTLQSEDASKGAHTGFDFLFAGAENARHV